MPKINLDDYYRNEDKYLQPEKKTSRNKKSKVIGFNEWNDDLSTRVKENKKKHNIKVKKQRNAKNFQKDI